MTTTTSRFLLNSSREDAKLVLRCAEWAAMSGGSFAVTNEYTEREWYTTVVINWPEGLKPEIQSNV